MPGLYRSKWGLPGSFDKDLTVACEKIKKNIPGNQPVISELVYTACPDGILSPMVHI